MVDDKKTNNVSSRDVLKESRITAVLDDIYKFKTSVKPAEPGVYGEVYISEIAAKAVKENKFLFTGGKGVEGPFRFPTGSIIVREKIANRSTVESLAVMIKRESSFNPEADGWQFLDLDAKTLAVTKDDQVVCLSCHKLKKETDFVFNSYKP